MEARAWKLVVSEADEEELGSRPEATIQILEIILFCGLWKQLAQGRFPSAVGDVKDFVRWFVYVQIPGFGTVIRELWNASVSVNLHHVIFPFTFRRVLVGRSDVHAKLSMHNDLSNLSPLACVDILEQLGALELCKVLHQQQLGLRLERCCLGGVCVSKFVGDLELGEVVHQPLTLLLVIVGVDDDRFLRVVA
jgi:hypothetical protein